MPNKKVVEFAEQIKEIEKEKCEAYAYYDKVRSEAYAKYEKLRDRLDIYKRILIMVELTYPDSDDE